MGNQLLPDGVQRTAVGVARVRAAESRREDRLFADPYAKAFVRAATGARSQAEHAAPRERSAGGAALAARIVLRTRFFDDYLLRATAAGCRQVVLLAAGLDTRAFRLTWPEGTRVFELDLPPVVAFKERVLREEGAVPTCERSVLTADLREDWGAALREAGFDPAARTAWLVEGLLVYLETDQATSLLSTLTGLSAAGSLLSLTEGRDPKRMVAENGADQRLQALAGLWKGGLGEPAADWLPRHGWQVTVHGKAELEQAYGRPAPAGSEGFLIAERG
ncbi:MULTISPECIES: SAM-dependent methyltransferase [Streptacidiphilus]|uniref:S-adenosyl-L-methionine-dependent methyltransferase n=1 Tax=Streptacidiphilus cavernicola TaxID=3342716 RepID=A0ABV6UR18_9ACTN|nr:SAM-dependent methyltransferase [Streptacidiphilus jeojiense]